MNVPPSKPYKPIVSAKLNALVDESEGLPKPEMSSLSDMQLMESCKHRFGRERKRRQKHQNA
jgi:hypothetical protein